MPADPASVEVRLLQQALGLPGVELAIPVQDDLARWAASGAMHLTGPADGPPSAPRAPVASRLAGAAAVLAQLGGPVLDGPALLGRRAALRGLSRHGQVSAGGASRLLPTADGWLVVTLSRPDDVELVPAWLHGEDSSWEAIAAAALAAPAAQLAAPGQELGLAVAAVALKADPDPPLPWRLTRTDGPVPQRLRVLDLSALWAGPLCAHLLHQAGADVLTVDSVGRPDGARVGDADLHALLHQGHASEPVDLRTTDGRARLRELVDASDMVISSVRGRALGRLGFDPAGEVERRPGLTWVAVTGYGLASDRVAFGDDAAAAAGLVAGEDVPVFCADAAADPATGLYAAIAALACARSGGGLVDVALHDVARHLARPPLREQPLTLLRDGDRWLVETADGPVMVEPPR